MEISDEDKVTFKTSKSLNLKFPGCSKFLSLYDETGLKIKFLE